MLFISLYKTAEGTRLQLVTSEDHTDAVVVSTLMEAWQVIQAGLVEDGTVKDVRCLSPIYQDSFYRADVVRVASTT
jgi:D-serine ammonia-lyase